MLGLLSEETSTPIPHENFLITYQTQRLFDEAKIDFSPLNKEAKGRLYHFFASRLFERQMRQPMRFINMVDLGEIFDEKGQKSNLQAVDEYYQRLRPPLLVYSSAASFLLQQAGYLPIVTFDVVNLFGANKVSPAGQPPLFGDYLLRDICGEILGQIAQKGLDYRLMRVKGDEFVLLKRQEEGMDQATAQTEEINQIIEGALSRVKSVYLIEGKRVFKGAEVDIKKYIPFYSEFTGRHLRSDDLDSRRQLLIGHHPEISDDLKVLEVVDSQQQELLLSHFEYILQDKLLQETAEEFTKSHQEAMVALYRDSEDFLLHVERSEEKIGFLLKVEIPGVGKLLNKKFGYGATDNFLRSQFHKILEGLYGTGLRSLKIDRRGVDFFVALPQGQDAAKVVQALQDTLKGRYELADIQKKVDLPIIPVVVATPLSFDNSGKGEKAAKEINRQKYEEGLARLSSLALEQRKKQFQAHYRDSTSKDDWEFLGHYLNPYSKRGILYLADFDFSDSSIKALKSFYTQKTKKKEEKEWGQYEVDETPFELADENLDKFIKLIRGLLFS